MSADGYEGRSDWLASKLNEVIVLLREHGEAHWLSWAERCRRELLAGDPVVYDEILEAFGGMGSFNDLLVLRHNGHLIEQNQEQAVNDRLADLRTAIWTNATALRHEARSSG